MLDLLGGLATTGLAVLSTVRFEGQPDDAQPDRTSTYVLTGGAILLGASMIYGVAGTAVCHHRADPSGNNDDGGGDQ